MLKVDNIIPLWRVVIPNSYVVIDPTPNSYVVIDPIVFAVYQFMNVI